MSRRRPWALEVRLSGELGELPPGFFTPRAETATLYQVERAIRHAADNPKIQALVLKLEEASLGWSKAESLHRTIHEFRKTGKPTVAFVSGVDNAAYMTATAAQTLLLRPGSILLLHALTSESFFFKDFLASLGIRPELLQVGEYKAAGEMFLRREPSREYREELDAILSDMHQQFIARVASGRGLASERVDEALRGGPYLPEEARDRGLVDRIDHEDAVQGILEEQVGAPPRFVPLGRYRTGVFVLQRLWQWRRPRVAIVHACGVITAGESRRTPGGSGSVGARPLGEQLRKVRAHPRVRAVVLRVSSPGGSATGSEAIRRELELVARDKPVVVSMGDVAASGGYFIATAAAAIVAEPTTLTGSIGVIGGKLVLRELLDRLGIHRETRSVGENVSPFSPLRSFSDRERDWYQRYLTHFYEKQFLPVVAEGRKLSLEEADAAGRGRVWTGRQGQELRLVDELGGLEEAVGLACARAKLPRARARVVVYTRRPRLRELFSRSAAGSLSRAPGDYLQGWLGAFQEMAREDLLLLMPRIFRIR